MTPNSTQPSHVSNTKQLALNKKQHGARFQPLTRLYATDYRRRTQIHRVVRCVEINRAFKVSLNTQGIIARRIFVLKRKKNVTHIHARVQTPAIPPNVTGSAGFCQRFRGPGINITSFLSIRAYLFPSSYCTSVSDLICIPGKPPDESRPWREGKTEWDKDEEREEARERERNEGRGSLGQDSGEGRKSERDHLRFTEGMKYDGVLPWVITDESGYKTAHCPKWLICPAAWRYKSWLSY